MNFGRIQQVGTPLHIYDDPAKCFRRRLYRGAGHEHFPRRYRTGWRRHRVRAEEIDPHASVTHPAKPYTTAEFGIRPEFLTIDAQKANGGAYGRDFNDRALRMRDHFPAENGRSGFDGKGQARCLSSAAVTSSQIRAEPDKVLVFDARNRASPLGLADLRRPREAG